eukprot:180333_1
MSTNPNKSAWEKRLEELDNKCPEHVKYVHTELHGYGPTHSLRCIDGAMLCIRGNQYFFWNLLDERDESIISLKKHETINQSGNYTITPQYMDIIFSNSNTYVNMSFSPQLNYVELSDSSTANDIMPCMYDRSTYKKFVPITELNKRFTLNHSNTTNTNIGQYIIDMNHYIDINFTNNEYTKQLYIKNESEYLIVHQSGKFVNFYLYSCNTNKVIKKIVNKIKLPYIFVEKHYNMAGGDLCHFDDPFISDEGDISFCYQSKKK